MRFDSACWTSRLRPPRKPRTSSTIAAYSGFSMRPTHGAVQRLIWYCRQGRVRVENMPSEHERNGKARCSA